ENGRGACGDEKGRRKRRSCSNAFAREDPRWPTDQMAEVRRNWPQFSLCRSGLRRTGKWCMQARAIKPRLATEEEGDLENARHQMYLNCCRLNGGTSTLHKSNGFIQSVHAKGRLSSCNRR